MYDARHRLQYESPWAPFSCLPCLPLFIMTESELRVRTCTVSGYRDAQQHWPPTPQQPLLGLHPLDSHLTDPAYTLHKCRQNSIAREHTTWLDKSAEEAALAHRVLCSAFWVTVKEPPSPVPWPCLGRTLAVPSTSMLDPSGHSKLRSC